MNNEDQHGHGEIIIVRRSNDDHDEHHGGVWKIAFADFMTAMMAFFLVMWLINASNEKTKKALASYFTPVKLVDTTSSPKGVRDSKYGVEAEELDESSTDVLVKPKKKDSGDSVAKVNNEEALFSDPFTLLSEIEGGISKEVEGTGIQTNSSADNSSGSSLSGGLSFQDPFDPTAWNIKEKEIEQAEDSKTQEAVDRESIDNAKLEQTQTSEANNEELTEALNEAVENLKKKLEISQLDVEVKKSVSGSLIVLSDNSQSGMFNIGSARPKQELVRVMSELGQAISEHNGQVEISGHTDGRKYQSGDYDNWRLSTARAHMAYYMLLRGGMQESKVQKITGQADKRLKMPDDPLSPANRRIEVLLKPKS